MPATRQLETAHDARAAQARELPRLRRSDVDTAATAYGPEDSRALFTLTVDDLALVATTRKDETRLGLALLLVWARAERRLVSDPATLPAEVTSFVASQIEVAPEALAGYGKRPATRTAHVKTVCRHLGLRAFRKSDEAQLRGFLEAKVAQTGSTAALREAAEMWLVREGLLRPAYATLDRLIQHARAAAERRLFSFVAGQLDAHWRARLDRLCDTEEGDSELMLLRSPPRAPSASSLRLECRRLASIRDLLPGTIDWGAITPSRRRQWARTVRRLYAQALGRYPSDKRQTLLLAYLTSRAEEVTDVIVEIFDTVIGRLLTRTDDELTEAKAEQAEAQLDSARVFRLVAEILLDPAIPEHAVRDAVFRKVPRYDLGLLVEKAKALDRGHVETFLSLLKERFPYARAFVPDVLATLRFEGHRADDGLLRAMGVLQAMGAGHRRRVPVGAPTGFIPPRLRAAVIQPGGIDRRAWELCLLSEIRAALRAGELTVVGSRRYTPWDAGLYGPDAWPDRRGSWYAEADLPSDPQVHLQEILDGLHTFTLEVAGRLPGNGAARVEHGRLLVDAPERLELTPGAEAARRSLCRLLPLVDLPDLLMEVDRWCGFSLSLLHLTARNGPTPRFVAATRAALFAVLVAEATNLGLETMARASGIPYGQLVRVHDWCFREETLRAAVATLLDYHQTLPLTARFGAGTTSSSDGMRLGLGLGPARPAPCPGIRDP